jgi:MFS family permease
VIEQLRKMTGGYPRSFWFLFWGLLISRSGTSMVWPFLTIYMRQKLDVPLTTITLLITLNSVMGLIASFIAGPAVDRFGRKAAMVISLGMSSLVFVGMSTAGSIGLWVILISLSGGFGPLYNVGANAMIADLIEPERRASAYALLRMIANAGVAIGPMIGGFVISISYSMAFYSAAMADILFTLLILFFVAETVSKPSQMEEVRSEGGYGPIFRDRSFLVFCGVYVLAAMAYSLMMVLLPVYAKENFGVAEQQFGFIMATNAAMVVFLQYTVTRISERFHNLPVLAVGSLFYAIGVGSVAFGRDFASFLISMVILTIGEMIMIPTSTALAANLAPHDMRGRYMGIYGLTWGLGFGIGPVIGGLLNDYLAPAMIWYGGLVMGLLAVVGFLIMTRHVPSQEIESTSVEG